MNYAKIKDCDIANGPGVRVSLFVSGCRNHCPGCFNAETWDFNYGSEFTKEVEDTLIAMLSKPYIRGLSILGGEPFEPENIETVTKLCRFVFVHFGRTKDIWVYTGYDYEDLQDLEIMSYIDVLVDGKFVEEEKDISLQFRGSKNQRIINVLDTVLGGAVSLWEDPNKESDMRFQPKMNRVED